MRTITAAQELLGELNEHPGGEIEDQDLDFKEGKFKNINTAVELAIHMAICMANGSLRCRRQSHDLRTQAIRESPLEIDSNRLKKAVCNFT